MNIYSIDGKVDITWHPAIRTVVESWTDYSNVELEEFRKAVFVKGINHSKASQGLGWIFDGSQAKGEFPADVQAMIDNDRFPALGWVGAKYFININPAVSEVTMQPGTEATRNVQSGEAPSVQAALDWITAQA